MMQITDEMVERGARALHAREMPGEPSWLMDYYWERLAAQYKEEYRQRARACLEAALGGEPSEDVHKAELDAARKHLDEAQGITDDVVEVGARAIMDMEIGLTCVRLFSGELLPWNEWPEDAKEERRKVVRAVLCAVLPMLGNAAHGITDEMMEAAAKAMYEADEVVLAEGEARQAIPWTEAGEQEHKYRREMAGVALRAVFPLRPAHLCDTCASCEVCFFRRLLALTQPLRVRACVTECGQYKPDGRDAL